MKPFQHLYIGGNGEAVMTRNFFSQSFNRYNAPNVARTTKAMAALICLT